MTNEEGPYLKYGVWAGESDFPGEKLWVEAQHLKKGIGLRIGSGQAILTPAAARLLAKMLTLQARRWEKG